MRYRILGPLEVRDGETSLPLAGAKPRALLALLLLDANRVLSRDRLIEELWGDQPPATAVTSLQVYVSRLRKLLPDGTLLTRAPGYLLEVARDELDLHHFERLLTEGRRSIADGDAERAAVVLHQALALWRGPALAEFAFEPFAQAEITRLEDLRLSAVEERIEADLAVGRHNELIGELEALIAENPYRERLRRQLILALYRSGRQVEALDAYRQARRALDKLGIEPSGELAGLERGVLTHDPELSARPTKTRTAAELPSPLTPLIGRSRELSKARALLHAHRIVTLVGPGGSGKTRLAIAVAEATVEEFPDGFVWVSLQALRDPELVLPTIAHAAGATRDLADHLRHRRVLLVLDNLEQVVAAAPQIADLLQTAPNVKLLATSREPLHLSGEREYPVLPLEEPDAVSLFVQRAGAVTPDFQGSDAVAQICRRLDCLPLAIELAAARTRLLSAEVLLERLDAGLPLLTGGPRDAPARQRTLHATIDWSYKLLGKQEKLLFRRLAVFSGGFTLMAAERIAHAEMDTLQSLIDKNLVRRREAEFGPRYWMLETIRDFAGERLEETTEHEPLARAHAEFFTALAERFLELRQEGANTRQLPGLRQLIEETAAEHANLRTALGWSLDREEGELAARLFASLHDYWIRRDFLVEGRRWAERVLSDVLSVSPRLRARSLHAAAELAYFSGDLATAAGLYARSLEVARELGDDRFVGRLLMKLANVDSARGDLPGARRQLEESLRLYRALGDERTTAVALQNLGEVERDLGNTNRAKELLVESVELLRTRGSAARLGAALHSLGDAFLDERSFEQATSHYTESLQIARGLGTDRDTAYCLAGLASAAAAAGDTEDAARIWGAVEAIESRIGVRLLETERGRYERALGQLDQGLVDEGREFGLDAAVSLALERRFDSINPAGGTPRATH